MAESTETKGAAMHTFTARITLSKTYQRAPQTRAQRNAQTGIVEMFNTRQQKTSGWELVLDEPTWTQTPTPEGDILVQEHLLLSYSHPAHEHKTADLHRLLAKLESNAANPKCGRMTLTHVDGKPYSPPSDVDMTEMYDAVGYANCNVPEDWDEHFTHLYGLDSHIERVRRALEEGERSGWTNRFNTVLFGPPGCGKSDIATCVAEALGEDAVIRYSATETTGAGAINDITGREVLPRVIVIEEIEKADPKALDWLLAILDIRGEVRKVTARENVQRDAKLFAICTVNDYDLFKSLRAGALESRFTTKVAFKRPSRETLAKILVRELDKVGGDHAWIDPCLDFCEGIGTSDPREITAHCLCGREQWLDGSYAKMVAETTMHTETVLANTGE